MVTPHPVLDVSVAVLLMAPMAAIPVAMHRLFSQRLPCWAVGGISGVLVCAYWILVGLVGLVCLSDLTSLTYLAVMAACSFPVGLFLGAAETAGFGTAPDWTYLVVPYALLLVVVTAVGVIGGLAVDLLGCGSRVGKELNLPPAG